MLARQLRTKKSAPPLVDRKAFTPCAVPSGGPRASGSLRIAHDAEKPRDPGLPFRPKPDFKLSSLKIVGPQMKKPLRSLGSGGARN